MYKLTCLCLLVTVCINRGFAEQPALFEKIGEFPDSDGSSGLKSYYIAPKIRLSWAESLLFCQHFNMDLVEIQSVDEKAKLLKLLKNYKKFHYEYVFIGGTKLGKDYWYWLKTGQKAKLKDNWFCNEPNNDKGNENCLAISKKIDTGEVGFNDANCYGTDQMFVCQDVVKRFNLDMRTSA